MLDALGYSRSPNNYLRLKSACVRYGLVYPSRQRGSAKIKKVATVSVFSDRDAVKAAVSDGRSAYGALKALGVSSAGKNYDALMEACHVHGLEPPVRRSTGKGRLDLSDRFGDRDAFVQLARESRTQKEMLAKLGRHHTDCKWLREAAVYHGVGLPNGRLTAQGVRVKPLEEILVEHSTYHSNQRLKNRLIKEGLLVDACLLCGLGPEWNGLPIILHLDHINGVRDDNRLGNLRVLCPNCHSQTDTFTGRNVKRL